MGVGKLFKIGLILEAVDHFTRPARKVKEAFEDIKDEINEVRDALEDSSRTLSRFNRGWEVIEKTLSQISQKFQAVKEKAQALKDWGRSLMLKGTAAVTFSLSPTVASAEFEKAMAEASTLVNMSLEDFRKKYEAQILDVATEIGESPTLVAKAFYQAISAGYSPEEAVKFLKEAGKAAIAGVSDIFTSVDLGTSIKNAFGLSAKDMRRVYDVIFQSIRKGKTTFNEINAGMEQILSSAAAARLKFEDVMAAMTQMTLTAGTKAPQAFTDLKYAIDALVSPSDQAKKVMRQLVEEGLLPEEINVTTLRTKGLIGTMEMLRKALLQLDEVQRAEVISKIFGSQEAQKFVNDFIVHGNQYIKMLKTIEHSHGAAEKAFQKMKQTASQAWNELKSQASSLAIAIGDSLLPEITSLLQAFKKGLEPITAFAQKHKTLTATIVGGLAVFSALVAVIGGLGFAIGVIINGYANLKIAMELVTTYNRRLLVGVKYMTSAIWENIGVIKEWIASLLISARMAIVQAGGLRALGTAFLGRLIMGIRTAVAAVWSFNAALLSNPITWVVAAIALLGGALYFLQKRFGLLTRAWNWIKAGLDWLKEKFFAFGSWLKTHWQSVLKVFLWVNPFTAPIMALNKLVHFVSGINLFEAGKKILHTLVEGIKSVALKPYEAVKSVLAKVRKLLPFSPAKEGPLSDLNVAGVKLLTTVAENVKGNELITKVSSVLHGVRKVLDMPFSAISPLFIPIRWAMEHLRLPELSAFINPLLKEPALPEKTSKKTNIVAGNMPITVNLHLTQNIEVSGGGEPEKVKSAIKTATRDFEEAVYRALMRVMERNRRLSFAGGET